MHIFSDDGFTMSPVIRAYSQMLEVAIGEIDIASDVVDRNVRWFTQASSKQSLSKRFIRIKTVDMK